MCLLNHTNYKVHCACPSELLLGFDGRKCVQPKECRTDEFRCTTGACIDSTWRCNGTPDCLDESDEQNCPKDCLANQFVCLTGRNGEMRCLDNRLICDNVKHCLDGFDEMCCGKNEFRCRENRNCLSLSQLCDGKADCQNGEDELPNQCDRVVSQAISSKWYQSNVFVTIMGFILMVIVVVVVYRSSCMTPAPKIVPHVPMNDINRNGIGSAGGAAFLSTNGHLNIGLRLDNCNTMTTTVSEMVPNEARNALDSTALLLDTSPTIAATTTFIRNPNNTESGLIDRVINGGSSATSSSAHNNYPHQTTNPPPSPVASSHSSSLFVTRPTTLRNNNGVNNGKAKNRRHKKSRWPANLNRGPPPTPCHTDTYEDIEPSNIRYLAYNNSTEMDESSYQNQRLTTSVTASQQQVAASQAPSFYQGYHHFSGVPPSYHPPSPSTERSFTNPYQSTDLSINGPSHVSGPPPSPLPESD